jgi:sulfur-oxidizing protein SoxX
MALLHIAVRVAATLAVAAASTPATAQGVAAYRIDGDAIAAPLAAVGDAARGRAIVGNREQSGCVLCHAVAGEPVSGNIGPPLAGVGARLSAEQLRLRIVDSTRINPHTPMPAYHRVDGLTQVAAAYRGKPVLNAQEVEDVVAWLSTLRGAAP